MNKIEIDGETFYEALMTLLRNDEYKDEAIYIFLDELIHDETLSQKEKDEIKRLLNEYGSPPNKELLEQQARQVLEMICESESLKNIIIKNLAMKREK